MKILVSNDDGYFAPGITLLAEALRQLGAVTVVAPERDRSGASNSLTLDRPLTVRQAPNGFFSVNGTPTDCVHIAVTGLLDFTPDVVVSGINLGANMGDDTIYSGTVAAAAEGYLLGIPSLALSLASKAGEHFESAIGIALQMVERFRRKPFGEPVLLNVNVPDVAASELRGVEITRLGRRHKAEAMQKMERTLSVAASRENARVLVAPTSRQPHRAPGWKRPRTSPGAIEWRPSPTPMASSGCWRRSRNWHRSPSQ